MAITAQTPAMAKFPMDSCANSLLIEFLANLLGITDVLLAKKGHAVWQAALNGACFSDNLKHYPS